MAITDGPRHTNVMATAAMAQKWANMIGTQRTLRPLYVEQLAHAMARGEWRWSTDSIGFIGHLSRPADCRQVNGMHRTNALIRADQLEPGIEVPFTLTEGLTEDAALAFDTGRMRTLADTLDFQEGTTEQPGHRDLASVVTLAWHVRQGTWANRTPAPTRLQLLDFLKNHDDLLDVVQPGRMLNRGVGGGISGYAVAVWLMSHGAHVAKLVEFVEAASSGEMLRRTDPPFALRETVRKAREAGHVGGERSIRSWWIAGITVLAWNAYVSNERRNALAPFRRTDEFPVAQ